MQSDRTRSSAVGWQAGAVSLIGRQQEIDQRIILCEGQGVLWDKHLEPGLRQNVKCRSGCVLIESCQAVNLIE